MYLLKLSEWPNIILNHYRFGIKLNSANGSEKMEKVLYSNKEAVDVQLSKMWQPRYYKRGSQLY